MIYYISIIFDNFITFILFKLNIINDRNKSNDLI